MSDQEAFEAAQQRVRTLAKTPTANELLDLYAWYKQASVGDVTGKRPGMLDVKGRAKFDAWQRVTGKSSDEARREYIALVERLEQKYGNA